MYKLKQLWICCIAVAVTFVVSPAFAIDNKLFPRPASIEPDVKFWVKVFTEINTKQGFIHDDAHLGVVYEKINIPQGISRKSRQKHIEKRKKHYSRILSVLASGKTSGLTQEERRIRSLWPETVSLKTLKSAKNRLRFQLGQSDKYLAGLKRSGAWKAHIIRTLDDMGLPREISSLPHVESSFNPKAYSKVGAAGLWQFTRSTGRRFLRVDHVVDERMDPFKASVAAARLLENNYSVTGTWPLALTAYNHGAAGMRNAAKKMGTTDITTILRKYRSRSFKFASRNFYVAFLAAVEVEQNAEKYFGKVALNPAVKDVLIRVPGYMSISNISSALGLSVSYLRKKNPGLRSLVWNNQKYVPRGYEIRIGKNDMPASAKQLTAKLAATTMHARQKRDLYHRVRRGQTLSVIARRYKVRIRDLMAVNNLRSKHRIRVGQRLRLPQRGGTTLLASSANSNKRLPVPDSGSYKVRRGDTVEKIAKRYRLKVRDILAYNNLGRRGRIYPGQKLRVKPYPKATTVVAAVKPEIKVAPAKPIQVAMIEPKKTPIEAVDDKVDTEINNNTTVTDAAKQETESGSTTTEPSLVPVAVPDQTTTPEGTAGASSETILQSSGAIGAAVEPEPEETISETVMVVSDTEVTDETTVTAPTSDVDQLDDKAVEQVATLQPVEDTNGKSEENTNLSLDEVLDKQLTALDQGTAFSAEANLVADPIDYSVMKNSMIEVQAAETLGHYAEWLKIRASKLRRVNKLRFGTPVIIGKRIKLVFSKVTPEEFEKSRKIYHQALQETFFQEFEITGSDTHTIRRGDSVWSLAKRKYKIPIWLLRQYNPDLELNKIIPGTVVKFPKVVQKAAQELSKLPDEKMAEADLTPNNHSATTGSQ